MGNATSYTQRETPLQLARKIIGALSDNAYMHEPLDEAAYELVADIIVEWSEARVTGAVRGRLDG